MTTATYTQLDYIRAACDRIAGVSGHCYRFGLRDFTADDFAALDQLLSERGMRRHFIPEDRMWQFYTPYADGTRPRIPGERPEPDWSI